jgi:resuscitation-promoting factor RpfB
VLSRTNPFRRPTEPTSGPTEVTPGLDTGDRQPRTRRVPRRTALVAQGTVVLVLAGGVGAWASTGKTVTLTVDGEEQQVDTRAGTVQAVLAQAGYEADERDLLAPAPDTEVNDGDEIVLRRARELNLTVDGRHSDVWVTAADVDEALTQVGLLDERAFVSADRSREIGLDGMELEVRTPKELAVVDGGAEPLPLVTTEPDVGSVLEQADVELGPEDVVSVPVEAPPASGVDVVVTRVASGTGTYTQPIDPPTVREEDSSLARGQTRVASEGSVGERVRDIAWRDENGVRVSETILNETVSRQPEPRVVRVGTRAPAPAPAPAPSRSSAPSSGSSSSGGGASVNGGLNWAALAACESGGNPRATNPSGKYRGLYQFDLQTWRSVGGSGDPAAASPGEQTSRAQALYNSRGRSPWPECGKRL